MPDYPGTSPNRLTYAQAMGAWVKAGGPAAVAPIAAAIAEAESGLDANEYNPTDNNGTQTSWGLWQISNGTHSSVSSQWNDPGENAKLAVAKYNGARGFSPWGTYDSGAYRQYVGGGTPDPNVPGSSGSGGAGSVSGPGSTPAECLFMMPNVDPGSTLPVVGRFFPSTSTCLFPKSAGRKVVGGGLLVAGGIIALIGVIILVRLGATRSGAVGAVAGSAAAVPGGAPVAAKVRAAGV